MPTPQPLTWGTAGSRIVGDRWGAIAPEIGEVILLHGGGQTRHAWRNTALLLAADGWTVLTYDARGHGESAWNPEGHYGQDGHLDDLLRVAEHCRTKPVLIGASMGGMTSILACGEHPGGFRGLVAVDVGLRVDTPESRRVHAFMSARPDGFADLEEAAEAVHVYNPTRTRPASPDGLKRNLILGTDGRWRWHWDPRILDGIIDRTAMASRLRQAAKSIAVPTLLVRGSRSQMVDDEGVAEFRRLVPQLQVADITSASHMVAGDDNDSFAGAVRRFLQEAVTITMEA